MKRFKGIIKDAVVVLEDKVCLPEGTEVIVVVKPLRPNRNGAFERLLLNPIRRPVGMDEIIEADKQEREDHWHSDGSTEP